MTRVVIQTLNTDSMQKHMGLFLFAAQFSQFTVLWHSKERHNDNDAAESLMTLNVEQSDKTQTHIVSQGYYMSINKS